MRVLFVEDEVRFASALSRGLRAEGFEVDHVRDGASGLAAARDGNYDAVLLDVMLPRMSGYTVVQRLREAGNWVPVMMLSARDAPADQAGGLDHGADDYLVKPFSYMVFLARLRALLRRGTAPQPVTLEAGDLRLESATREVTRAGELVALTPREFAVLEYLMANADRVVTKTELLDEAWDAAADVDPNVVEVYVGYLRRKLGRDAIRTVRGSGYRIG